METRTPHVVDYPSEDGGKTACNMLRWFARTVEKAPWSETGKCGYQGRMGREQRLL